VACVLAERREIEVIAPVHDAIMAKPRPEKPVRQRTVRRVLSLSRLDAGDGR